MLLVFYHSTLHFFLVSCRADQKGFLSCLEWCLFFYQFVFFLIINWCKSVFLPNCLFEEIKYFRVNTVTIKQCNNVSIIQTLQGDSRPLCLMLAFWSPCLQVNLSDYMLWLVYVHLLLIIIINLFICFSLWPPAKDVVEQTVCIVQSTCVNVHSMSGKDFISPLPFQVRTLHIFCRFSFSKDRTNYDSRFIWRINFSLALFQERRCHSRTLVSVIRDWSSLTVFLAQWLMLCLFCET